MPIAFVGLLDGQRIPGLILCIVTVAGILSLHGLVASKAKIDWHNLTVLRLEPDDLLLAATDDHPDELSGLRVHCVSSQSIREDGEEGPDGFTWSGALVRAERA